MQIHVDPAERAEQQILTNLMQLYVYDFSEMIGLDVQNDGRFADRPLASYWEDSWRFPFVIRAGEHLAGFALVHRQSKLTKSNDVWDMDQFFVLRKYRRSGVGRQAAHQIFSTHPGRWEIRQTPENAPATAFWRKTISDFSAHQFTEIIVDDTRWRGPVQFFNVL